MKRYRRIVVQQLTVDGKPWRTFTYYPVTQLDTANLLARISRGYNMEHTNVTVYNGSESSVAPKMGR